VVYEDELRHQDYMHSNATGLKDVTSGSGSQSPPRYEEQKNANNGMVPYHESVA
jgi:hypothetical protein